jgi:hypothetical protein
MSWTNATPTDRLAFPLPARLFFITITVVLVLVSGLLGLMASILMLSARPMLRPTRRLPTQAEPAFRLLR